jgi:4-amino-4-deoxy-L-arabinose transferase-like glycosyltransferase
MISAVIKRLMRSKSGPYLLLGVTALGSLFYRIGWLPFLGSDECRYARIAEEMSLSGRWITPILQGYPWLEKPPLYYWITIIIYKIFGVSEGSARVGPAICALLAAASIFWLGSRLWSRRAGFWGGLIMLTSLGYYAYGRSASTDMPLTACFTIAFALLAAAVLQGNRPIRQILGAYALLGLAVLAKGPAAFVLTAGILLLFWVLDEEGGSFARLHIFWGAAVALAVAVPWHWLAFRENGFTFIASYLINHNFARYVTEIHHHEQPMYYFFPVLLGLMFPWSGWLPALITRRVNWRALDPRAWDRSTLFLACWAVVPFVFFSLSNSKLPGYVLPCLPPLSLLLGRSLAERVQHPGNIRGLKAARWFYLVFSLTAAAAAPVAMWMNYKDAWEAGLMLGGVVIFFAVAAFWAACRGNMRRAFQATVIQSLAMLIVITQVGFAPLAEYNSAHEIAGKALAVRAANEPIITFAYFDHTLHYYTGYQVSENIVDPGVLLAFAGRQPTFLVVTTAQLTRSLEEMPELSVTPLANQGKLCLLRARLLPRGARR